MSTTKLTDLLAYVDYKLTTKTCKASLRWARQWMENRKLTADAKEKLTYWLEHRGASCDCGLRSLADRQSLPKPPDGAFERE